MILLENANKIVEETLREKFGEKNREKPTSIDLICADFDGVTFHIYTAQGNKKELFVSVSIKCFKDLLKYGAEAALKQLYGEFLTTAEAGYDVTLKINIDNVKKESLPTDIAMIKTRLYGVPFEHVFNAIEKGQTIDQPICVPFRDFTNEKVFFKTAGEDRVLVIFTINFKDPDDIIIGKVFLQEFKKSIGGAPSVDFIQKDPPRELAGTNIKADGFVTFVLFKRHFEGSKRLATINTVQTFRNYLHYHIKCAKSHLHTRMRNRVDSLLKVLNRSKQKLPTEKKTATGRTFVRRGGPAQGGGARGRGRGVPAGGPGKRGGPMRGKK